MKSAGPPDRQTENSKKAAARFSFAAAFEPSEFFSFKAPWDWDRTDCRRAQNPDIQK